MDYKEQAKNLVFDAKEYSRYPRIRKDLYGAANSITELLARAETAEKKLDDAEEAIERRKKLFAEYQVQVRLNYKRFRKACNKWEELYKEAEARAEKAEKERDAAIDQLRGECEKCAHYRVTWNGCTPDYECPLSDRCLNRDLWEWDGGEKEE